MNATAAVGGDSRVDLLEHARVERRVRLCHQVIQAGLEDRNLATFQACHLECIDIDADDVVADFGQTGSGDQSDIAGPKDCNAHLLIS